MKQLSAPCRILSTLLLTVWLSGSVRADPLAFRAGRSPGEFTFDTGMLRGTLRREGKSLGLSEVIHIPTGKRLDRSNGLLSHYRVFTRGVRYGGGAWDWPSEASLRADGTIEVIWSAAADRPFGLAAVYRLTQPDAIEVETRVTARTALIGFESFLASYFAETFTNAAVCVVQSQTRTGVSSFQTVAVENGTWQVFPRQESDLSLIRDGRWRLEPNPVDWTIGPMLKFPVAYRRDPAAGLVAAIMSSRADCFAIASPQQFEPHYSLYLCLFGSDIPAGETRTAKVRLLVTREDAIEGRLLKPYLEPGR